MTFGDFKRYPTLSTSQKETNKNASAHENQTRIIEKTQEINNIRQGQENHSHVAPIRKSAQNRLQNGPSNSPLNKNVIGSSFMTIFFFF